jgi:putative spermidine/putrescine transport system ATP-binding protein
MGYFDAADSQVNARRDVPDSDRTAVKTGLPVVIRDLTKQYGDHKALDAVDLTVASGEFTTLLGPSGSGKTTLLMTIAGFIRPTAGSVKFGEQEMVRVPPNRRNVGVVFQNYALFPHMNVAGNVGYPLRVRKYKRAQLNERIERALELVRLAHYKNRRVDQLSGGEQQRVALARAIVFEPKVLLMDEPLSALDKKLRDEMQIEIRRLHDKLKITTISVTHDQTEALTMADRVAIINHGRIEQIDTPHRIYERPANKFVAEFIGKSTIMAVRVVGNIAYLDGQQLKIDGEIPRNIADVSLVIRPEKLEFLQHHHSDNYNVFRGRITSLVYKGDLLLICLTINTGVTLCVERTTRRQMLDSLPSIGDQVTVGLHARDTLLVPTARQ